MQNILQCDNGYDDLDMYLDKLNTKSILLVCGKSIKKLNINNYIKQISNNKKIKIVYFNDFHPNPKYESVVKGIETYNNNNCDTVLAIGGGSAIDVAKCIKLYCGMDNKKNYLNQEIVPNNIPFIAMPTTSGTGSESTRFAVIYYNNEKKSVTHESIIPQAVIIDSSSIKTLPIYQKKVTMLDALCHSIESYWSINSTEESREYSSKAIKNILKYKEKYLENDDNANKQMLLTANIAGKAINITQTTAGHALSYKLTSLYTIPHGHAVAICIKEIWPWMYDNMDKCIDKRGKEYLNEIMLNISYDMGCKDVKSAIRYYSTLIESMNLKKIEVKNISELDILKNSVNLDRLKNNPVRLDENSIKFIYKKILNII